jgi:hypothetical protein
MSLRHTRKLSATNRLLAYCRKTGEKRSCFKWEKHDDKLARTGFVFAPSEPQVVYFSRLCDQDSFTPAP